jgi:acyl-CoA synthetase (NDP forming)
VKGERGPCWLAADEASALLQAMKLPVVPTTIACTRDEAVRLADKVGYPVAVKLASRTLIHKTDVGGVQLNLGDADAVCRAFERIQETLASLGKREAMDGVLVQPMIRDGVEIMVGATRDPLFGPMIAFGLGGIHLEVLRDVVFRIAPLSDRDADEMIDSIRGRRLLDEFRGRPPVDREAIRDVILRLSRLAEEVPEIREIDLNPIIARERGHGCIILDARISVE